MYKRQIYVSTVDYYELLIRILYLSKLSTLPLLKQKMLQVNNPFPSTDLHQKQYYCNIIGSHTVLSIQGLDYSSVPSRTSHLSSACQPTLLKELVTTALGSLLDAAGGPLLMYIVLE